MLIVLDMQQREVAVMDYNNYNFNVYMDIYKNRWFIFTMQRLKEDKQGQLMAHINVMEVEAMEVYKVEDGVGCKPG